MGKGYGDGLTMGLLWVFGPMLKHTRDVHFLVL